MIQKSLLVLTRYLIYYQRHIFNHSLSKIHYRYLFNQLKTRRLNINLLLFTY